ncbi:botulinum neurotoxin transcription-activating sigma factor BotR [Clostridium botulinum]|uniref:p21 n=2 Tax=Clostridium botulinum TaxID=1491 RepID=B0FNS1_CLOBO|nr:botulinum neurotoxin transcription-activating sigma factor BotR [Clostridium botulinum]ABY56341.1 P21 [Clostridium botulinum]ACQ51208.1 transcriptional regulator BotR [Clostridium botulinum Ba4 str. 657]AXG90329.1 botulinum neurotoxin transcription-activating sigma factor BotR [Clostridium botulinum]EDT84142.1 clostridium toxin-associated regulator BotR [Clostridium botulinum Bf]MBY6881624.1 botulinum neurotoxin transcription-activating sigma factor BotR [Clostridium botulinum]
MENLFFIIKILKDDNKKFEDIYTNYKNLIDIFIKKYNLSENYNDILNHFWIILKKADLNKFNTENDLNKYISKCLKRYCLSICTKKNRDKKIIYNSEITDINLNLIQDNCFNDIEFEFKDLISILPNNQKNIIYMKFFKDMKDIEIAKKLKISRQSVYKNKNLALEKLKPILKELINI